MAFPASPTKVQTFVQSAETRAAQLQALMTSWKPVAATSHSADDLVSNWLPTVRSALEGEFRDSSVYTAGFKSAVSVYVATRLESPPPDWWAEYDNLRAQIIIVRNRMVSEVPATWGTVDGGGTVTWTTLPANQSLANGMQLLIDAVA